MIIIKTTRREKIMAIIIIKINITSNNNNADHNKSSSNSSGSNSNSSSNVINNGIADNYNTNNKIHMFVFLHRETWHISYNASSCASRTSLPLHPQDLQCQLAVRSPQGNRSLRRKGLQRYSMHTHCCVPFPNPWVTTPNTKLQLLRRS